MTATEERLWPGAPPVADVPSWRWEFDAYCVGALFNRDGIAFLALGDGTVRLVDPARPGDEPRAVQAHDGACLGLGLDIDRRGVLTGGDDGALCRLDPSGSGEGAVRRLAHLPGRWIEKVATAPASGLRAYAAGKVVHVSDGEGRPVATLQHASTVADIAFDPRGARLAAAHYGGVTYWMRSRREWPPTQLVWKGSHVRVTWSPDNRFLMSAMQEAELHGWRLRDRADMRMSGYPSKVKAFSWSAEGHFLATSGADRAILWPFDGKSGPMGRPPVELGAGTRQTSTCVACHPRRPVVATGFESGVVLLDPVRPDGSSPEPPGAGLPESALAGRAAGTRLLRRPGGGAVTTLAWSPDGNRLLVGTEEGAAALYGLAG